MDVFKNSKIAKSLASAPPKHDDRDPKDDHEPTLEEMKEEMEKFEELPDPMGPAQQQEIVILEILQPNLLNQKLFHY